MASLFGETRGSLESRWASGIDDDQIETVQVLDFRLETGSYMPLGSSLFLLSEPSPGKPVAAFSWGGSLESDYFTFGRLELNGSYRLLHSPSFPSVPSWDEKPRIIARKGVVFNDRFGGALHYHDNLILHYREEKDRKEGGLFFQIPRDSAVKAGLAWDGGLLFSQIQAEDVLDEDWFDPDISPCSQGILHGLVRASWLAGGKRGGGGLSLAGAASLPERDRPSLLGLLMARGEWYDNSLQILVGLSDGEWLTDKGEESRWQEGFGWSLILFDESPLSLEARGKFWSGISDDSRGYDFSGKIRGGEWLVLAGKADGNGDGNDLRWTGEAAFLLAGDWTRAECRLARIRDGDGQRNKLRLRGELTPEALVIEGEADFLWEEGERIDGGDIEFEGSFAGKWKNGFGGQFSLMLPWQGGDWDWRGMTAEWHMGWNW